MPLNPCPKRQPYVEFFVLYACCINVLYACCIICVVRNCPSLSCDCVLCVLLKKNCCIAVSYFSACGIFVLYISAFRIQCYIFTHSGISCWFFVRLEFLVIYFYVRNVIWYCGILCYILLCVERALVLWNFVLYFLRVERALVLWNFVFCFSACEMCSGIVEFCVIFFCVPV